MTRLACCILGLVLTLGANGGELCLAAPPTDAPLQLTLPRQFYAVAGLPINVYFDNIVLTETSPDAFRFTVKCPIGTTETRRWTVTPAASEVGEHAWSVEVRGAQGEVVAQGETVLHVVSPDAGAGHEIQLLIVGDSLTHATLYPNELARLLSEPGNPRWKMLGTHRPQQAADGVAHEGYGGWTWQRFVSQYEPNPDGTYRKRSSPFVFLNADGKPHLNVTRYLREENDGKQPDYVIFLLGINDCFSAPADDPRRTDERIDAMLTHADTLLTAFRTAAPSAQLGVAITTPPNARDAAFVANYQERYPRWGWKRIQHRLVQRLLERFETGEPDHVFVIPTQLNLDPIDGYPDNNAVHPNSKGYQQIAVSIYACLKAQLATAP